jgi:hypothetical protein
LLVIKAKIQVIITQRTRVKPGFFVEKLIIVENIEQDTKTPPPTPSPQAMRGL